jgi:cell division protein ZapA (FtsZ GTPase activity inhibitor)
MGKDNSPQTVNIDGTEYKVEDLSDKAKALIDHVSDLDRKMGSMRFQMDQIQVGRDAFFAMLKTELETKLEVAEEVVQ